MEHPRGLVLAAAVVSSVLVTASAAYVVYSWRRRKDELVEAGAADKEGEGGAGDEDSLVMDTSATLGSKPRSVSVYEVKHLEAVGGHAKKGISKPILQHDGYIYKPFQGVSSGGGQRMRGELEAEFYAKVHAMSHPLTALMPRFFGVQELDDGEKYLVLEDLTCAFEEPCVLDLKMGRRSYDENASPEKVEKEKAKYPPQEIVGFRLVLVYFGRKSCNFFLGLEKTRLKITPNENKTKSDSVACAFISLQPSAL